MSQKSLTPQSLFNFPSVHFPRFPNWGELTEWSTQSGSGLNVYQTKKDVIVEAKIPGLKRKEIKVTLDRHLLCIFGEKKEETHSKNKQYFQKSTSSYTYNIELPSSADLSKKPKTSYKDGILTLTFNKRPSKAPKEISI